MNIGMITSWFDRGAGYVSRAYKGAFEAAGHTVFIYARGGETSGRGHPAWDLPGVTWAPRLGFRNGVVFDANHLTRWLRDSDIDIVFFNEERNWSIVELCKQLGYTVGAYVDYYTPASVPLFNLFDFLVCNTQRHYSVFRHHPQCLYVPWGTNTELFVPGTAPPPPDQPIRFFHNAGISFFRKGTDLVLRAFQQLKGDARLFLHVQRPLPNRECPINPTTDPRITVLVQTVPPPGLYHLGDVYVYPSRLDGIGLTVCEALACGLPVITTDEAPMNEFVTHEYNGLCVPVAQRERRSDGYYWPVTTVDVEALAARMQWYVDDPRRVLRHAQQARQSAETQFCWKNNVADCANQITGLVQHKQKTKPAPSTRLIWAFDSALARIRAACIAGAKKALGKTA